MAWARLDDRWHDHPKTIAAGLEAAGLFAMCLTWAHSARRTSPTPGVVPDGVLVRLAGRKAGKLADTLHSVGFFDERTPAGWPIHDFNDYLPNYDPEQAKKNGSLGGKAKAAKQTASKPLSEPPEESVAISSTRASARRNPVPVPIPNNPHTQPSPSPSDGPAISAQTVTGTWVDAMRTNGTDPSKRMVGEVARTAKDLLEKNDPHQVVEAARLSGLAGYTTIDRQLAMMNGKPTHRPGPATSGMPLDRARDIADLSARMQARADRTAIGDST